VDVSAPVSPKREPIVRLVALCAAHAWILVAIVVVACAAMTHYVTRHFAMTTDTYALLSPKLPWRVRQSEFNTAFPPESSDIVVVVDGQTPELSEAAAATLAASLSAQKQLFHSVQRPDGGPFWAHNGLLFASTEDVKTFIAQLLKGQPFLGSMATDPSLRGLANTLGLAIKGVNDGEASPQSLITPIRTLADALHGLSLGRPTFFSWMRSSQRWRNARV